MALTERHGRLQNIEVLIPWRKATRFVIPRSEATLNLVQAAAFSPGPSCYPAGYCEIATAPFGASHDKLGSLAPLNLYRKQPTCMALTERHGRLQILKC